MGASSGALTPFVLAPKPKSGRSNRKVSAASCRAAYGFTRPFGSTVVRRRLAAFSWSGTGISTGFANRTVTAYARYWDVGVDGLGYEGPSSPISKIVSSWQISASCSESGSTWSARPSGACCANASSIARTCRASGRSPRCSRSRACAGAQQGRHRLDDAVHHFGDLDDRTRSGLVLRRPGPPEEHAGDADEGLHRDRYRHAGLVLLGTNTFTRAAGAGLNENVKIPGNFFQVSVTNNGTASTTSLAIQTSYGPLETLPNTLTNSGNLRTAVLEAGPLATDATAQAIQALSDTMLYFITAMLEKMPMLNTNDQAMVAVQNTITANIAASQTLANLTTLNNYAGGNTALIPFQQGAGAPHIYQAIQVSA